MTVQPVDLNSFLGDQGGPTSASGTSTMFDKDMFLALLVAQMRYQNPLDPMKSTEFMQQAAQLASVEAVQAMAAAQTEATALQTSLVAASLVGREVTGIGLDGQEVTGLVTSVSLLPTGVTVQIGDTSIPLGSVTSIGLPSNPPVDPPA